jgi:hypothetical protein
MSTSTGLNAFGFNPFRILVVVTIVYMFAYSVRSHMFINIVTSMLLLSIFWIKLLVNLAKFPTPTTHCAPTCQPLSLLFLPPLQLPPLRSHCPSAAHPPAPSVGGFIPSSVSDLTPSSYPLIQSVAHTASLVARGVEPELGEASTVAAPCDGGPAPSRRQELHADEETRWRQLPRGHPRCLPRRVLESDEGSASVCRGRRHLGGSVGGTWAAPAPPPPAPPR